MQEGLRSIDKARLNGEFKVWCLQYGLYPRLLRPLTMYEIEATRVERIEQQQCSVNILKDAVSILKDAVNIFQ